MTLEEAKKILKKEGYDIEKVGRPCSPSIVFTEYESPEICEAMQIVCSAGFQLAMLAGVFDERKERLKKEYGKNHIKGDFSWKNSIISSSHSLKESSSQFNDALLDEQAKKIAELTKEKSNLEDQITVLNSCKKHNDKIDRKQIKCLGKEIAKLNGIIHDKNAILSDVAEELRLTKIREKNLAELGLKYVGENEKLKKELADLGKELKAQKDLVDDISLKYDGAKHNLKLRIEEFEKLKKELADKVVDKIDAQALKSAESALAWKEKVIARKDMALAYDEKKIAEKDEVIADLGNELEATKKELEAFKESYKRRIKEDSEHFEHIQKICNAGLQKWLIESEYLEKDKPFRFPQLPDFSEEEQKKVSSAKDTHPTEDKPEEIAIEKAVKLVCKAMKEGHTVTIKYEN